MLYEHLPIVPFGFGRKFILGIDALVPALLESFFPAVLFVFFFQFCFGSEYGLVLDQGVYHGISPRTVLSYPRLR